MTAYAPVAYRSVPRRTSNYLKLTGAAVPPGKIARHLLRDQFLNASEKRVAPRQGELAVARHLPQVALQCTDTFFVHDRNGKCHPWTLEPSVLSVKYAECWTYSTTLSDPVRVFFVS